MGFPLYTTMRDFVRINRALPTSARQLPLTPLLRPVRLTLHGSPSAERSRGDVHIHYTEVPSLPSCLPACFPSRRCTRGSRSYEDRGWEGWKDWVGLQTLILKIFCARIFMLISSRIDATGDAIRRQKPRAFVAQIYDQQGSIYLMAKLNA